MTAVTDAGTGTPRVLASWYATGRVDLEAHRATHGSLPVPAKRDRGWADRFVQELADAGLTGRGGAGFPTARKVGSLRAGRGHPLLVLNAMEGEPASHKDRALVTSAPHLVLDGAELVATAIGAGAIAVCIARERTEMVRGLRLALSQRRGPDVMTVPVEVLDPPGRFVAGEESALVHWIAGGQAKPTFRPARGVPLSIGRRPALVHNPESLAHAALVARHGAAWFRAVGTSDAPGTALVTVTGTVGRPGVYEVPLGTPLSVILRQAGLSRPPGAVLLGGYGGAWIPPALLDTAYAPAPLAAVGGALGAGVIGVIPDSACGVAETARIVAYLAAEGAGQCGPCVFGLPALAGDLAELARGAGTTATLARLRTRLGEVAGRGACRHPDGAVRLVQSALGVFASDLAAHARRRPCPGWNHRPVLAAPARGPGSPWR